MKLKSQIKSEIEKMTATLQNLMQPQVEFQASSLGQNANMISKEPQEISEFRPLVKSTEGQGPALEIEKGFTVHEFSEMPSDYLVDHSEDRKILAATQNSMEGFDMKYLSLRFEGTTILTVPVFYTYYRFSTMVSNKWLKAILGNLGLNIACLGNPVICFCRYEGQLTRTMNDLLFDHISKKSHLVSYKGFQPGPQFDDCITAKSVPVANFTFSKEKWAELQKNRNLARKIKAAKVFSYSYKNNVTDQELEKIYEMYEATYERAEIKFGKLSKSYFEKSRHTSTFVLVHLNGKLVGFSQVFVNGKGAVATFLGMDYTVDRSCGLYFAIYFAMMKFFEESQIETIDLGETAYEFKRRIGCEIQDTWIFYRHKNKVVHYILSKLKFILEPSASELK